MSNKNEKISIIVPVYNGEEYIGECIGSIINQTYNNIEIIIVNDGSTDNSMRIVNEYAFKDNRIKIVNKKNSGVSESRNIGLDNCTGKYICLVDQDDYINPYFLEYLYNLLKSNGADIALTPRARRFDNKTKHLNKFDDTSNLIEIWANEKATEQMLYYNLVIAPWNKLICKKLIDTNNIVFRSNLFGGEGFLFSIECFQFANKIAVGQKELYNYRVDNPNSGMTSFNSEIIYSSIRSQELIKESIIDYNGKMKKACKYSNWHTYCDCLNTIVGCKVRHLYPVLYQDIKKVCRKDALISLQAPISKKEKIKGVLYYLNPFIAAKIINKFRLRKFTIDKVE